MDYMGDYNSNYSDYFEGNNSGPGLDFEIPSELGPSQVASLVFYGLVFLLGAPGNAVVIWVTAFRMPNSVNLQWFQHLALADLLCCLSLPLLMVPLARDQHWPYGPLGCKLLTSVFSLTMYCSVLLLMLISLDRWLLVRWPIWCQNRRTPRRARWVCLGMWVLALLLSLPHAFYMKQQSMGQAKVVCMPSLMSHGKVWALTIFRSLLGFLLPFLVIVGCHWVVYTRTVQGLGQGRGASPRSQRTLRVICAVVVSFFLCWIPLHVTDFLHPLTPKHSPRLASLRLASVLALCLAYFNSCLNPLLYVCLGPSFKDSLRRSFRGMLSFLGEESNHGRQSITNTKSTCDETQEKTV